MCIKCAPDRHERAKNARLYNFVSKTELWLEEQHRERERELLLLPAKGSQEAGDQKHLGERAVAPILTP